MNYLSNMYMWEIAILSHKRPLVIASKTLATLLRHNIPVEKITIFVAPCQIDDYKKSCPNVKLVPTAVGKCKNRTAALRHYPHGQKIVFLDDDIEEFYSVCAQDGCGGCWKFGKEARGGPHYQKQMTCANLSAFFYDAFSVAEKEGVEFWGIYPVENGFFAKHTITRCLAHCIGRCYGIVNTAASRALNAAIVDDIHDDYQTSLRYFLKDGKCLRFNYIFTKSPVVRGSGGIVDTRTIANTEEVSKRLSAAWPEHIILVQPDASTTVGKFWDIKLRRKGDRAKLEPPKSG